MPEPLYKFNRPFIAATVTARPSRHNKSPYLVDCRLDNGEEAIVHNPALKCNGLVEPGARVWLQPAASDKSLSKYVLYLVSAQVAGIEDVLVCIHPTIANEIAESLICRGYVAPFIEQVRREVTYSKAVDSCSGNCRFDFYGLTDGADTYIEVKSASMAVGEQAIFPYGDGKKKGIISERALKHVEGLAAAAAAGCQTHLVYISMRPDISALKVSERDAVYRRAVFEAKESGVKVVAFSVRWTTDGSCWFERRLDLL